METLNEIIERAKIACDLFHPITIYSVNSDVWNKKYLLGHKLNGIIGKPIMEIRKNSKGEIRQKIF